jgi:glyceraldehyde 3-phosphate dehydrogenase
VTVRVGVNGFGRIGRNFWRAVDSLDHDIEIVAVNDLTDTKTLAHLLKYDSILGKLPYEVTAGDGVITVNGKDMKVLSNRDPGSLPWGELGVDVVIESTGFFTKAADAGKHLLSGVCLRLRPRRFRSISKALGPIEALTVFKYLHGSGDLRVIRAG